MHGQNHIKDEIHVYVRTVVVLKAIYVFFSSQ